MNSQIQILLELLPEQDLKPLDIPKGHTSLWEHWETFVTNMLRLGRSETTVRNVRDALRFLIRHIGFYTIESVNDRNALEDLLLEVKDERGLKSSTYNSYRKNINTYFIWLKRRGLIVENKVKEIQKCKVIPKEQLTLTHEQVMLVLGQICVRRQTKLLRLRNHLFMELLRYTGARPCELLELKIENLRQVKDTYEVVISGRKQKGRIRSYRAESSLRDAIDAYLEYRIPLRPEDPWLFTSSSKKNRWTVKGMRKLFNQLSKELGFKVTAYGFRRYVATTLYLRGVDIRQIAYHLGHTRVSTTVTYIESTAAITADTTRILGQEYQENLHRKHY